MSRSRPRLESRVYSIPEVAELFGMDDDTVRDIARAEGAFAGVPAIRVTAHQFRFSRAAINRVLDGESPDATTDDEVAA